MSSKVKLFDQNNIDSLNWPNTPEGKQAQDLFLPMIKEGVEHYIKNVTTRLFMLQVDDHVLPVTVNDKEYDNSYLTSNYFAIRYLEEMLSQKKSLFAAFQKQFIKGIGFFLKKLKINKIIIINNWLLTTNIYPNLSNGQVQAITEAVKKRFPDHVITFRSLDEHKCSHLANHLAKHRYRLLGSRFVFIYDPAQKVNFSSKVIYHHRRDRRLIETEGYKVFDEEGVQSHDLSHLLKLYNNHIYISRHTKYSPQYTEKYLKRAIEKGFFKIIGLKKEDEILGVLGCFKCNGTMTIPFFGYDTEKGEANHLYRMLTILAIEEAEKKGMILNDGSGSSAPKRYRGMKPFPEYIAIYDRHLPFYRRLFWGVAQRVVNGVAFPLVKRQIQR